MVDKRITGLTEYDAELALDDVLEIVDTSDTTDNAAGSSFKAEAKRLGVGARLVNGAVWVDDTPPSDVVWIPGCVMAGADSSLALDPIDEALFAPFVVVRPITITQMTAEITDAQASSTCRLGIYEGDGSYNSPNALKLDAGTVDSSTTGQKDITGLSTTLEPGVWWSVVVTDTAAVNVRTYDASPITASIWDVGAGVNPYVVGHIRTISGASTALPATVNLSAGRLVDGTGGWRHPIGYLWTDA